MRIDSTVEKPGFISVRGLVKLKYRNFRILNQSLKFFKLISDRLQNVVGIHEVGFVLVENIIENIYVQLVLFTGHQGSY